MKLHADLDGGNIEVVDATDPERVRLRIRTDTKADEFRQWFHFVAEDVHDTPCAFEIENAGETTYPDAWEGYDVCASYDLHQWFRVPSEYEDGALRFAITPEAPSIYFGYFAPYSQKRHDVVLADVEASPFARTEHIGRSVQGRTVDLIIASDHDDPKRPFGPEKRVIWVIARQHPGEVMAEWFMEGLVGKLLDADDPIAREVREKCVLYLVPNMNPDGSRVGNLRANAAGFNLNRAWLAPDPKLSPEVLCVRKRMHQTGVDLFLDVHGDERNPYCFLAGCEGNPGYSDRLRELENLFEQSLCAENEDFQDEYGYDRDEPGGGDLRTAGNYVGETFDCLSYTLEMPFKDVANNPDPMVGWSPDRAKHLGGSVLESILVCVPELR